MKTLAIIQARMGSQRLPGKTLMTISNYTLLETVIRTVKRNNFIDEVVVATSNLEIDDAVEKFCQAIDVKCFRGDETNVLSRFISIAKDVQPNDTIVRVTADNPINNHEASQRLFEKHTSENADYTCVEGLSHIVYEFIKAEALVSLEDNTKLEDQDKEHVTKYIREHPEVYKVVMEEPESLSLQPQLDKLLTIDSKQDYQRFKSLKDKVDLDQSIDFEHLYSLLKADN